MTVEWTPGYDGGAEQSFIIVYREYPEGSLGEEETTSGTSRAINDLSSGTQYEIMIYSQNKHGRSEGIRIVERTRRKYLIYRC